MKSPRTHGITALVTLALTLSALLPWNALAGEVSGMIMPDPQPGPQQSAGDPEDGGGGLPRLTASDGIAALSYYWRLKLALSLVLGTRAPDLTRQAIISRHFSARKGHVRR